MVQCLSGEWRVYIQTVNIRNDETEMIKQRSKIANPSLVINLRP